jgi:DNA-binding MarR family transcriptional regulator
MTTGQLTRETGVSPRTADRWLDALDRHGLLRRRPDPAGDMRNALVELSPGGASAMQQWLEAWIKSQSNAGSDNRVIDLLTRLQQDNE